MPYTLKPNKLFAKDPNGDGYLPQNVVTDQSTAEQVALINSTGAAQVSAIQAKGVETLDSIPDDYTALQGEVDDLKSAVDEMGLIETPFETTWEIGGLNTTGAGVTASNRVRNKPAFIVLKHQKIVVDHTVEIRICYYKTSDSSYDHWNSTGYETGTFELEYGYKARILGRYVANPTSDISSVTPFYTLIQIITDTYKEIPSVDDTLSISGDAADAKATGDAISQIAENFGTSSEEIEITNTLQTYWNVESTTAVKTSVSAQFQASDPIPVKPGEVYTITSRQGETHKARIWTVTDDDYTIISMAEDYYDTVLRTNIFTIPTGGTKLLLTKQLNTTPQKLVKHADGTSVVTHPFSGKKLSLLGDSISAYTGTVPSGYAVYYTGSNSGVSSPDQMWWSVLCEKTGMEPLVINGLSGSAVTQLEDSSHVRKIPMSSDERCNGLHTENANPDVIIIAGGVNDYSYAESAQSEPLDWNPTTTPVLGNSFTEAYACMIKKLQTNYPSALIIALSSWFTMRGTDNGYTLTHTVGNNVYTQQDYNDKIRFVAEQMHIPYIDVSNIGFNRNNFYPNYAQDSSTIPTHPNASGHYVMASAIASKMLALANGYFN